MSGEEPAVFKTFFFQSKFSEFGRLIDVHDTGNGFAFVTYNHKKEAKKAIREMNGATVAGYEIKVKKAEPKKEKVACGPGSGAGGYESGRTGGYGGQGCP